MKLEGQGQVEPAHGAAHIATGSHQELAHALVFAHNLMQAGVMFSLAELVVCQEAGIG